MAKKKSAPAGDASANRSEAAVNESLPSTIEPQNNAFDNLRNKIEAQLQKPGQSKGKDKPKPKKSETKSVDEPKKTKPDAAKPARGKKRDRSGQILDGDAGKTTQARGKPRQVNGSKHEDEHEDVDEVFRKEVQALGGTDEDLKLLADAASDSELEEFPEDRSRKSRPHDIDVKGLNKGMGNILKEIALAQGESAPDQDASNSDEADEDDDAGQPSVQSGNEKAEKNSRGKKQPQFLCEPKADWFNVPEPDVDMEKRPKYTPSSETLDQLYEYAKSLLAEEHQRFKDSQQSSSAQSFYNTVIASGTLSDRISALTLAVQESPIHNMRALETLLGLAWKRSRSQAVDVLRALKDLFAQGSLLPESRKLYAFRAQPTLPYLLGHAKTWKQGDKLPRGLDQARLVVWAFESWLKELYFEVLQILETWCSDEIEFSKSRAVSYVFELLKERPEQESNLLRLLINKLGDPVKKIASQASYLLMQLLISHPAMKMVVVSAIESDFIFRPGQSMHGKYYAVVTLNQTAFSGKEEDVAKKLLDIYFGLFSPLLKMTAAPEPTTKPATEKVDETPAPRRRRNNHKKPAPVSGQAQAEELREKLISAILTGVNRAYPYAGADGSSFNDHLETLFKITHSSNFNTSIQAMMLIQQLSTTHKASNDRFYRVLYESMLDPRLIIASKQQLYLNLLHRALKADLNVKRVKAFVKRLVQLMSLHEPSFICGVFFLIQDLESTFPSLAGLIDQPEDHDDEEVFRDVDEDAPQGQPELSEKPRGDVYDGHKRAPEHANADNSCVWEILPFLAHFHPSVSVSADHLLRHAKLPGKPDLSLHTLSHFLDRFVYRNPKLSSVSQRGSSIMQPMANDSRNVLIGGSWDAQRRLPVNCEAFKSKKSDDVAADDVFFHRYFSSLDTKVASTKVKKAKKRGDDDEESGDDEDEVWKAMMDSAPDLEGAEESDDDVDLSELDSEMDALEDEAGGDAGGSDDDGVDIDPAIFDEDEDDLMEIGEDVAEKDASEVSDFDGFGDEDEEETSSKKTKKGKKADREADKEKAKKLKRLPTFASAEDYSKMLDDDEDEDMGM
jgi:ribosome biogenesis protein MAK21